MWWQLSQVSCSLVAEHPTWCVEGHRFSSCWENLKFLIQAVYKKFVTFEPSCMAWALPYKSDGVITGNFEKNP